MPSTLSALLNARLSRYAVAAAAAVPAQAAPITLILPTPIDLSITSFASFDVDQDGLADINFTAFGGGRFIPPVSRLANFAVSGTIALQLAGGVLIDITSSVGSWNSVAPISYNTAVSPTFLAFRYATASSAPQRVGFAQFSGSTLYGFAWDQANTITTFDITAPTGVPEPATGALTALALGAVALAARKRKQA